MRATLYRIVLAVFVLAAGTIAARAEKWLKIMPDDPYSQDGSFHLFDIDSALEDRATHYVAARMTYGKPAEAAKGVSSWYVWAFDCKGSMYAVSSPGERGTTAEPDWRTKGKSLKKPLMGGVTNMFGKKLCALKGSWPEGELP